MLNKILVWLRIKEKEMKKFWIVYSAKSKKSDCDSYDSMFMYCGNNSGKYTSGQFDNLADAEKHAKQQTAANLGRVYVILEAMTATVPPVPEVVMETLVAVTP